LNKLPKTQRGVSREWRLRTKQKNLRDARRENGEASFHDRGWRAEAIVASCLVGGYAVLWHAKERRTGERKLPKVARLDPKPLT
jgi:hypothetical protein